MTATVWRFQVGTSNPKVVTGLTHDRSRFGFWPFDDEWSLRFDEATTIYLRVTVGPGWDKPRLIVHGEATLEMWQRQKRP